MIDLSDNPDDAPLLARKPHHDEAKFDITAMIDLALRESTGPVALAAISARQQISLSYLEQLFGKLRRHELVESTRGPGGGYSLGRKAGEITVADIIVAVDEPIDATGCQGKTDIGTGDVDAVTLVRTAPSNVLTSAVPSPDTETFSVIGEAGGGRD